MLVRITATTALLLFAAAVPGMAQREESRSDPRPLHSEAEWEALVDELRDAARRGDREALAARFEELGERLELTLDKEVWERHASLWQVPERPHVVERPEHERRSPRARRERDRRESWSEWGDRYGERWAEWGERQAELWAEWGGRQGEQWAEWGEARGEDWEDYGEDWEEIGERWAEWGEQWGEVAETLGEALADAFADVDWYELDEGVADGVQAVDWRAFAELVRDSVHQALTAAERATRRESDH
jgi:hypothetical protein